MPTLVNVDHLVKVFPVPGEKKSIWAVNDVSFSIGVGETLALVGESGSGKTTVGRCLVGLTEPSDGTVSFKGRHISSKGRVDRELRTHIRVVFQDPFASLNPRRTVEFALDEPLAIIGMSAAERRRRISVVLEATGLDDSVLKRYPYELSGGRLQAIGVARAMATDPEFIVLDEPTSMLDPSIRADIINLLIRLQRDMDVSYLFISHDLTTARYISQKVAVMYLGKIVEMATTEELFGNPVHPYSRALLGSVLTPDPNQVRETSSLKGRFLRQSISLPDAFCIRVAR